MTWLPTQYSLHLLESLSPWYQLQAITDYYQLPHLARTLSLYYDSAKHKVRSWVNTCPIEYSFILFSTLPRLMETPRGRASTVIIFLMLSYKPNMCFRSFLAYRNLL